MKHIKYTKELLESAVKNSTSISGVLRFFGLRETGGNRANINKKIQHHKIDTCHFLSNEIAILQKQLKHWTIIKLIKKERVCLPSGLLTKKTWLVKCNNCGATVERSNSLRRDSKCDLCMWHPKGMTGLKKRMAVYIACAKMRKLLFNLTLEEFEFLTSQNCYYCGRPPSTVSKTRQSWGNYIYNGIDRKDNKIGYEIENCVSCCFICNQAKMDMPIEDFESWIKDLVIHQQKKREK